MPVKDALRRFRCRYCGKEFTMFERSNGELIFYPENYPWACHGDLELTSHLRYKHRQILERTIIFYPHDYLDQCYERTA